MFVYIRNTKKKPTKQLLEVRSKFPRWQDIRSIYWINCILYNDRRKLENKILNTIPLKPAAISASESNKTWINHNPTKILFFFFGGNWLSDSKLYMVTQKKWYIQSSIGRKTKKTSCVIIIHDFKTVKTTVIKTEC